jgi:hypothetical protein
MAIFSPKLIGEVFKRQQLLTVAIVRQMFEKLAHSSIMKLNEQSMNRVWFKIVVQNLKNLNSISIPFHFHSISFPFHNNSRSFHSIPQTFNNFHSISIPFHGIIFGPLVQKFLIIKLNFSYCLSKAF